MKNLVISKQGEKSENFNNIITMAKNKNINIIVVKDGDNIVVNKDLIINILWPLENQIDVNVLNNNSIVLKINYINFNILFTGDIEEIAEKNIINKYIKNEILKSIILKIAHHGSKTSTSEEFLKQVSPYFSLIGVGKNNTFGHPNKETLERLNDIRFKNI